MSQQNVYDDPKFFASYKKLREQEQGFNALLETGLQLEQVLEPTVADSAPEVFNIHKLRPPILVISAKRCNKQHHQ